MLLLLTIPFLAIAVHVLEDQMADGDDITSSGAISYLECYEANPFDEDSDTLIPYQNFNCYQMGCTADGGAPGRDDLWLHATLDNSWPFESCDDFCTRTPDSTSTTDSLGLDQKMFNWFRTYITETDLKYYQANWRFYTDTDPFGQVGQCVDVCTATCVARGIVQSDAEQASVVTECVGAGLADEPVFSADYPYILPCNDVVACPDNSEGDDVVSGCTCSAGYEGTITAEEADPYYGGTCTAILCAADQFVYNNACVPCQHDATRDAGDDASGADTECTVAAASDDSPDYESGASQGTSSFFVVGSLMTYLACL